MVLKFFFLLILFGFVLFSFQKPTPVQPTRQLAQEFSALLDSLITYKHPTFEKSIERADFLIKLSLQRQDWDIYCHTLVSKISLAEFHDKQDLVEPFIKDFEKKLNAIDPKTFSKHELYKGELKLFWSDMYNVRRQPESVIAINQEIIKGIDDGSLIFIDNIKAQQNAYYNLGYWKSEIGDITKGISYFMKSKQFNESDTAREIPVAIIIYSQIAKRYASIGEDIKALTFFQLADKTAEILHKKEGITEKNSGYFTSNYHSLAKFYLKLNKSDSALIFVNRAAPITKSYHKSENFLLQAKCFIGLKKYAEAEKALTAALTVIGAQGGGFASQKPLIYLEFTKIKQQTGNTTAALAYCQKALACLDPRVDSVDWRQHPSVSNAVMKRELLEALQLKGTILADAALQSVDYQAVAYQTAQLAVNTLDTIRADYAADFDKQYLAQVSYPIYETAMQTAVALYGKDPKPEYLAAIFDIMEKSKAAVLLDALKKGQAEADFNEPDRFKTYQYRTDLAKLDKTIFDLNAKHAPLSDTSLQNSETRRATLRQEYEAFLTVLKEKYAAYAAVKTGAASLHIADVRAMLPTKGVYLAYFVGQKDVYSLLINAETARVFTATDAAAQLPILVNQIRQTIRPRSPDDERSDIKGYCQAASDLYDLVLKGPLSILTSKPQKLIISPDGALHFLPFDILLTEKVTETTSIYRNLPYLLRETTTSYVPSAALWQKQINIPKGRADKLFIGFAPQYGKVSKDIVANSSENDHLLAMAEKSGELRDMPAARHEVERVSQLLKARESFIGAAATEDNFKRFAGDYRILHLSMHAEPNAIDPAFSQFIFTQNDTFSEHNRLYLNELQNVKLNADLAVLSACETGYGVLSKGEGVMSLARAFASVGVPSTLMSLWKIPSGTTEHIALNFYTHLSEGENVAESLRAAKLQYLEQEAASSPYFWAGMVAIGDGERSPMAQIRFLTATNCFVLSLLIAFSAFTVYWIKRRRKRNNTL